MTRAIEAFVGRVLGFLANLVAIGLATPLAPYAAAIEAALATAGEVLALVAVGVELANLAFRLYDLYQHDFAVAYGLSARFQLDDEELEETYFAIAMSLLTLAIITVLAFLYVILKPFIRGLVRSVRRLRRRGGADGDGDIRPPRDRDGDDDTDGDGGRDTDKDRDDDEGDWERDEDRDRDEDQDDDRNRDGDEDGEGDGDGGPPKLRSGTASPYEFKPGVTLGPEDEPIINRLRNRMNKKGWQGEPIVVRFLPDGTKEILDGHHRVAAAKRTRKSIDVPWREASPEEVQFYLRHRQQ